MKRHPEKQNYATSSRKKRVSQVLLLEKEIVASNFLRHNEVYLTVKNYNGTSKTPQ